MTNNEIREALGKVAVELNELMQDEGSDEQHFIDILAEVDAALEAEPEPLAVVEGWLTDNMLTDLRHRPPGWFLYTVPIQKVQRGGFIHPVTVTITERHA